MIKSQAQKTDTRYRWGGHNQSPQWRSTTTTTTITHSLTHLLLRLTSEGRSDLHNERSCADDHSESIVHPRSSSTCCIQVFLGRPGGRFQSGAGHLPCERLTQCWRMWAGTSGGRQQSKAAIPCKPVILGERCKLPQWGLVEPRPPKGFLLSSPLRIAFHYCEPPCSHWGGQDPMAPLAYAPEMC